MPPPSALSVLLLLVFLAGKLSAQNNNCFPFNALASKSYNPSTWMNYDTVFTGSRFIILPADLQAAEGNAGNHQSTITVKIPSGAAVTTIYKGGSSQAHPSSEIEMTRALKAKFVSNSLGWQPGDTVEVTEFHLSVNGDSYKLRTTLWARVDMVCNNGVPVGSVPLWEPGFTPNSVVTGSGLRNVGIGINKPNYQLQLHNPVPAGVNTIQLTNGSTGSAPDDGFQIRVLSTGIGEVRQAEKEALKFFTADSERVTITKDGKVGIGTDTPAEALTLAKGSLQISSLAFTPPLPPDPNNYAAPPPPSGAGLGLVAIGIPTITPIGTIGGGFTGYVDPRTGGHVPFPVPNPCASAPPPILDSWAATLNIRTPGTTPEQQQFVELRCPYKGLNIGTVSAGSGPFVAGSAAGSNYFEGREQNLLLDVNAEARIGYRTDNSYQYLSFYADKVFEPKNGYIDYNYHPNIDKTGSGDTIEPMLVLNGNSSKSPKPVPVQIGSQTNKSPFFVNGGHQYNTYSGIDYLPAMTIKNTVGNKMLELHREGGSDPKMEVAFVHNHAALWGIGVSNAPTPNDFYVYNSLLGLSALQIQQLTNNVGIGTAEPKARLHVAGSAYINDKLRVGNAFYDGFYPDYTAMIQNDSPQLLALTRIGNPVGPLGPNKKMFISFTDILQDSTLRPHWDIGMDPEDLPNDVQTANNDCAFFIYNHDRAGTIGQGYVEFLINKAGNVGIGNADPAHKLSVHVNPVTDIALAISQGTSSNVRFQVKGTGNTQIKADGADTRALEIYENPSSTTANIVLYGDGRIYGKHYRCSLTNPFPDYVFDSSYVLKPIGEVVGFAKKNGHLEGFPNAAEVKQSGMDMGEVVRLQQEKIEQLLLYIEKLEKRVAKLETSK